VLHCDEWAEHQQYQISSAIIALGNSFAELTELDLFTTSLEKWFPLSANSASFCFSYPNINNSPLTQKAMKDIEFLTSMIPHLTHNTVKEIEFLTSMIPHETHKKK
jgi:uncharacterized protein (DUF305 family)